MKVIKKIEVQREGELTVFEQTVGVIDGERVVGETVGRTVWPGDDVSAESAVVRAVASGVHTPECVALCRARRAFNASDAKSVAEYEAAAAAYETARAAKGQPKR